MFKLSRQRNIGVWRHHLYSRKEYLGNECRPSVQSHGCQQSKLKIEHQSDPPIWRNTQRRYESYTIIEQRNFMNLCLDALTVLELKIKRKILARYYRIRRNNNICNRHICCSPAYANSGVTRLEITYWTNLIQQMERSFIYRNRTMNHEKLGHHSIHFLYLNCNAWVLHWK